MDGKPTDIVQDSKVASSVDDKGLLAAQTDLTSAQTKLAEAEAKLADAKAKLADAKANLKSTQDKVNELKPKSIFGLFGFGGSKRRKSIRRKKRFV